MKIVVFLCGLLIGLSAVMAQNIEVPIDVPFESADRYRDAIEIRRKKNLGEAKRLFDTLYRDRSNETSFSIPYEYGRTLSINKEYESALEILNETVRRLGKGTHGETPIRIYNTRGFVLLMLQRYEAALADFEYAMSRAAFDDMKVEFQARLFNNSGFANMNAGRYKKAQDLFVKAEDLGNTRATRNLAAVESLIKGAETGDKSSGPFVIAIASTRLNPLLVERKLDQFAGKLATLGVKRSDLFVFINRHRRYVITWGRNLSYSLAEARREQLKTIIHDAYTAMSTSWNDVSSNFR